MSDKPANNVDQPQEIYIVEPGTRGKIEAALENQDLKRVVALLIENQNNPAFLESVRNFAEGELQKGRKLPIYINTQQALNARIKFMEAIRLQVLRNPNCVYGLCGLNECKSMTSEEMRALESEVSSLQPIQISDDLFRLMEESGVFIHSDQSTVIPDQPDNFNVLNAGKMIVLQKSDGTKISMYIHGEINEDFKFQLCYQGNK